MSLIGDAPAQADLFARHPAAESDPPIIAIIDDDAGARLSTAWFLEAEGYRTLCFDSGDAFLRATRPERLACALLDLRMPGRNGLDVLRALNGQADAPPVVVVSGHADLATAIAAMKLKAIDLIQKPYAPKALLRALAHASAARARAQAARGDAGKARAIIDGLTDRQRQVLTAIVRGRANKMIAWELGLSIRTIEAHRAQLFQKMRVRNAAEAVRVALAGGIDSGNG